MTHQLVSSDQKSTEWIDGSVEEWLYRKKITKSGSTKTQTAYKNTIDSLRHTLQRGGLDLLSDPKDVGRVAAVWAAQRVPTSHLAKNGEDPEVAATTYNQRCAIVSSWYAFVHKVYGINVDNPIATIDKKRVQDYRYAEPLDADEVAERLSRIDQSTLTGLRDYTMLVIGLMTGRRASEICGLRWGDVQRRGTSTTILEFHCKGGKVKRDHLDDDTARVLWVYIEALYGKNYSALSADAPIWISFSRRNTGKAVSTPTLRQICADHLGVTKIHTLRHTFAKWMEKSGAPLSDIQKALMHESLTVTARYLQGLGSDENEHAPRLAKKFGIARRQ